jgi:hypothetical protein
MPSNGAWRNKWACENLCPYLLQICTPPWISVSIHPYVSDVQAAPDVGGDRGAGSWATRARARENACPWVRLRVFTGTGTGCPKKTQGGP